MTSALVVDASVVVGALLDTGPLGTWCEQQLLGAELIAPHLMPFEVANVLRRHVARGDVGVDDGSQALASLSRLDVQFVPATELLERAWQLRSNLTAYDASYVAAAELVGSPLATLDTRLAGAAGPTRPLVVYEP